MTWLTDNRYGSNTKRLDGPGTTLVVVWSVAYGSPHNTWWVEVYERGASWQLKLGEQVAQSKLAIFDSEEEAIAHCEQWMTEKYPLWALGQIGE